MTPRLSGHLSTFGLVFFVLKSLLGIARQWSVKNFAILSLKPRSHVRILIYRTWAIGCHKITKIVRALWLAERSVCMRVCTSRCFAFRALIPQARIWKSLLFCSFLRRLKLGKSLQTKSVSIFFRLSWHFRGEKSVLWEVSFCKTRTDYACNWLRGQDFATGKKLSFNQCQTKGFAFCFGKVIL